MGLGSPLPGGLLDWALTKMGLSSSAAKIVDTFHVFRISSTSSKSSLYLGSISSIDDSHRACHTILADDYFGLDQPLAALDINRHPHRQERRA
jgi:hypothetical protein